MAPGLNLKVGSLRLALWLDRSEMRNDLATRIYKAAVDGSEIVEPKSIETRTRLVFRVEADDFVSRFIAHSPLTHAQRAFLQALAHPPEAKFAHEAFLSAKSVVAQISTDRRLLAGLMNIALGSIRLTWNPFPSIHHRRNRRHNDKRGATYIGVVRIDKLVVDDVAINFDLAKGELNVCRLTRMLAFKKVRQALPFHERDSVPNMLSVELISSQHVVATQHRHMHCVVSVRHYRRQSAIQRRPKQSESDDVTWNEFFLIPCPDPSAVLHIGIYSTGGVASKSVLLAQWIVTAKMLVLDPSSVFAAAEDVKSYRGNASSRQASRLCEQTSEEAPTHRNRAFILEGKMRLRDKSFSLFDEEKDAPTLKLRLAYYYESSLPSQEKMLTNYRPLTALEQIQVSSLESTWKLGDPGLAKKMLREFPILIDPRMLVVNRINCNLRDLFSGSYAGTGELMRAKRTNRLVATVGKPVARAVRRQSKALIAKHDCVEETKANDPSNLESVRSSSLKADSLQRRAFEWKNARTTRAFQSRRNFHKDLGGEEDKHLYVKKLDFSESSFSESFHSITDLRRAGGKFQQYFEKRPEGIDLYKIVRTLVTSALVPVLKDHELTGGYAPILAGLAFSRKTALETRSELEDTLSKVPHRGVEEIPALPATAPNPTSEQTSFPSQDASLEEMSTADFYRRGQMQDSVSLQLDFVQQNLAQSGGGRRAAPKIAKRCVRFDCIPARKTRAQARQGIARSIHSCCVSRSQ